MKTYVDTSVLFSIYAQDANSARADIWRNLNPSPLPFTAFHRVELRNALGLAVFRQRLHAQQMGAVWQQIESDIAAGLLVARGGLWHRVLESAEALSVLHTPALGSRSLDVIHVAAAKLMGVKEFCTFDPRQENLAAAIELSVVAV